ncbi:MAG TPA: hypothetical protein VM597_23615 [Gemmataceae bacterium]|nr:hypothetical protein [Gemmataceae bacterium]
MTSRFPRSIALAIAILVGPASAQEATARRALIAPPARPGDLVVQADTVVLGKVIEIDKDEVAATPFPGAPKDQAVAYKVAVVKVEDTLAGGKGLTQYRVGFPANAPPAVPPAGRPRRPGLEPVTLAVGQDGCFLLVRHHEADFYIVVPGGKPILKAEKAYESDLAEVKKSARALEDPVAALKAKDLADRFWAGYVLVQKYNQATPGKGGKLPPREPVPAEERKLLVQLLIDLPWSSNSPLARGGPGQPPSRAALWGFLNPDEIGFKPPEAKPFQPGDPPVDFNKVMDEATSKFLKANGDKVVLKRYARE